jgi:hypothetical protein
MVNKLSAKHYDQNKRITEYPGYLNLARFEIFFASAWQEFVPFNRAI